MMEITKETVDRKEFEKPIIVAVSKGPFESQYIFNKDDSVPEACWRFFVDLGISEEELECFLVEEEYYEYKSGERFSSIKSMKDYRWNVKNKIYDIDFFIGCKKVILVIRTKKDLQQEIAEKLFKVAKTVDE